MSYLLTMKEVFMEQSWLRSVHNWLRSRFSQFMRCLLYGKQDHFNMFNATGL